MTIGKANLTNNRSPNLQTQRVLKETAQFTGTENRKTFRSLNVAVKQGGLNNIATSKMISMLSTAVGENSHHNNSIYGPKKQNLEQFLQLKKKMKDPFGNLEPIIDAEKLQTTINEKKFKLP